MFGGMDRGPAGDAPTMGQMVAYQTSEGEFLAGVVQAVREDGWTVTLAVPGHGDFYDFVPYGGNAEFGTIPVGSWVTLDAYEGWKIWAAERAERARLEKEAGPED